MNLAEFTKVYRENFKAIGGDPDTCAGVIWAEEYLKSHPGATISKFVSEVGQKIQDGTADHGWLLGSLRLNWAVLTQKQRLEYFAALARGGAHKALLNTTMFPEKLSAREADAIQKLLEGTGAKAAAKRFNRERKNRENGNA